MYLPPVDDLAILQDIVVIVLSGRKARVVRKYANAVTDPEATERRFIRSVDLAVLLRESVHAEGGVVSGEIEHPAIAASGVEL